MTDVATHRTRYAAMPDEGFATLVEEWFNDPASFTPEAREAIRLAMEDRKTNVVEIARARVVQVKEQKVIDAVREVRTEKRLAREGGWLGIAGLIASAVSAVPSIMQGHIGGIAASVACLFCSVFLIVRWRKGRA